jgi:hypothetical protein
MNPKQKLITFLNKGEKTAIVFVEAILEIFNDYDNGIRLFGKPFPGKFEADYAYMQTQIKIKQMSQPIDNPRHSGEESFSYKDQQEILVAIKDYKMEKKRAFLDEVIKLGNYDFKQP